MDDLLKAAYLAAGVFMLASSASIGAAVSAELRRKSMVEVAEDLALTIRLVNSTGVSVRYRLPDAGEAALLGGVEYTVRVANGAVEVAYMGLDWSSIPPKECEQRVRVSCGVSILGGAELEAGDIAVIEPADGGVLVGGCG